ncbi:hypothetical protein LCGC14_1164740 [marine sediment metagenome]|uniref:Uncharacterized protein n=1 Tax=marine sediment metagenome TaxID=412755 RepID=A0A0F9LRR0_9ZZZZ
MEIKHNCTKEGNFKFDIIAMNKEEKDKIKCKVCGRIWKDTGEKDNYDAEAHESMIPRY